MHALYVLSYIPNPRFEEAEVVGSSAVVSDVLSLLWTQLVGWHKNSLWKAH